MYYKIVVANCFYRASTEVIKVLSEKKRMANEELLSLAEEVSSGVNDEYFTQSLFGCYDCSMVDNESLFAKLGQIKYNLKTVETARDLATEIIVAFQFLDLPSLSSLTLGEKPDLILDVADEKVFVEVKRFRGREEDEIDSAMLAAYRVKGRFPIYGNSGDVQKQIESVLLKKVQRYLGEKPYFIYLWSDSRNEVENSEITAAVRAIQSVVHDDLSGVFYKWAAYPRNVILLDASNKSARLQGLFQNRFTIYR